MENAPLFERIYHPSDFSEASLVAFAHALKLSLTAKGHLYIHHVFDPHEKLSWSEYPGVRDMLMQWGILPSGSSKKELKELDLHVQKIISENKNPLKAINQYVENHQPDLIVLTTHQNHGIQQWLKNDIAIPLAQKSKTATLFIPAHSQGFVSMIDGSINLDRILIPIDKSPSPQKSIECVQNLIDELAIQKCEVDTLYVGKESEAPGIQVPTLNNKIKLRKLTNKGNPASEILRAVDELWADLIILTTAGRHGFLDALRGSTTEHIIQHSPCPVLAIPED